MSEVESQLEAYLTRYVGEKSRRQVAELAGINKDTWNRAMNLGRMQAESAIRFARAFDVQVVPFLRDLGFLTDEEVAASVARLTLEELSDVDLAREILRRVESSTLAAPLDEAHPARREKGGLLPVPVIQRVADPAKISSDAAVRNS